MLWSLNKFVDLWWRTMGLNFASFSRLRNRHRGAE